MRRSSLRTTLLFVSVLFAVMVVGGIALTSYVIVSDGMQLVAYDTTQRLAASAEVVLRDAVSDVQLSAGAQGYVGEKRTAVALAGLKNRLPGLFNRAGVKEADYALYDQTLTLLWSSGPAALPAGQQAARQRTLAAAHSSRSVTQGGNLILGLVHEARLGMSVMHVPVELPGGVQGVLDVTYSPSNEERVINAIRRPMTILALTAVFIMVVLMQTSMSWVLGLVDNLRRAADSIDAGRLEDRLPITGKNEIGELADSVNRLIGRLQRRADAQSRFVADASHELATPVAGIRGYIGILRGWGADDPKVRDEAIDAIDRESRRMARLSADLLNLLHADQGLVLKSEQFDINAMVRDRLAATASRWIDKDIEFVGPTESSLVLVGDPDRVEDVVSILLDNASKYTPAGGRVSVNTRRKREMVTIQVADTGQGIPPQDLTRIFDRFYRSEASRAAGEAGFGLGLAIAKSIVESMGGTIEVETDVGAGTTFTVQLPRGRV